MGTVGLDDGSERVQYRGNFLRRDGFALADSVAKKDIESLPPLRRPAPSACMDPKTVVQPPAY
jgi:hypothetical protein